MCECSLELNCASLNMETSFWFVSISFTKNCFKDICWKFQYFHQRNDQRHTIIKVVKINRSDLFFIINYANMRSHIFSLFSLFSRSCCLQVNRGSLQMRENVHMYCKKKLILCKIYFVVRSHFIVNRVFRYFVFGTFISREWFWSLFLLWHEVAKQVERIKAWFGWCFFLAFLVYYIYSWIHVSWLVCN